jgi:hypothetical protein
MEYVYLDTSLLAVPNYAVDQESAQELIDRVVYAAQLTLPDIPITIVIASDAAERLWGINCGPDYEQIAAFIELMEIDEYFTARDLVLQYQTILDRAVKANELPPVEVTEISTFEAVPPLPENLIPQTLRTETERVFSAVAARKKTSNAWNVGSGIQDITGSLFHISVTVVSAIGEMVGSLGDLPVQISEPVRTFAHLNELITHEASERLWVNADNTEELHFALTIGALVLLKEAGMSPELDKLRRFRLGAGFRESLVTCQCLGSARFASTTRTLCAQIISEMCNREIKPFGKPDQEIREFDAAKAWRVHITKSSEALRMMYWETAEYIEFANVGVKKELLIDRGTRSGGTELNLTEYL